MNVRQKCTAVVGGAIFRDHRNETSYSQMAKAQTMPLVRFWVSRRMHKCKNFRCLKNFPESGSRPNQPPSPARPSAMVARLPSSARGTTERAAQSLTAFFRETQTPIVCIQIFGYGPM
ncbi:MAG TPA: hypothetical protein DDZ51_05690 [Planctomycetaceae bacterium]|nr:hypothetical protein [Planctomycetaceae bacterium]